MNPTPAHRDPPCLEVRAAAAAYDHHAVFSGVDLAIPQGRWLGIIGPNGSGKTTLLRLLSGALKPSAGEVRLFGHRLATLPQRQQARWRAFVPQALNVPVAFTVEEFASLGRTAHLGGWQALTAADHAAIADALSQTGLAAVAGRIMEDLSGGERQRALIALALAQEPRVLLLDEPTAHLDAHHAWSLMHLLERLRRERELTIVMSSHDINLAATFCEQLALLQAGSLAALAPPCEVLHHPAFQAAYENALEVRTRPDDDSLWVYPRKPTAAAPAMPAPAGAPGAAIGPPPPGR